VFDKMGFRDYRMNLSGTHTPWEYCVQYRESDFDFVSRLIEDEGIFYYFEHSAGKHVMVLGDAVSAYTNCPGDASAEYLDANAGRQRALQKAHVTSIAYEQEFRPGKYAHTDYNFETPSTSLMATSNTIAAVGGNDKFEVYDYPGEYIKKNDGESLAKIRMQELETGEQSVSGSGSVRGFTAGYKVTLSKCPDPAMNKAYFLTEVQTAASMGEAYSTADAEGAENCVVTFSAIPANVTFRPACKTPRPVVRGPQTAIVVGPSGEEIYTDKYGRVKVQFHWDREGKKDEKSSCWIRVSQLWAGKSFGALFTPRMGQEVIVDFLEGDPDQPIITGRVYNAEQTCPANLPANSHMSGVNTRSTKGGGTDNTNWITFNDKKGEEELGFHAEKYLECRVEKDENWHIFNDETRIVDHDQTITVKNNRTEQVTDGNEKVTIKKGNRDHEISMGNDTLVISMGNYKREIKMGNEEKKIDLGSSTTEAMQSITLKVGANSITIDQTGITLKGLMITSDAQVINKTHGPIVQVNGDGMVQIQGGVTMIN